MGSFVHSAIGTSVKQSVMEPAQDIPV